jgi:hypothetical protein
MKTRVGLLVLMLLLAFSSVASAASGNGVEPTRVEGNPTCEDLGYETGFKPQKDGADATESGTYSNGYLTVTMTVTDGTTIDWSSNVGVDAVIVKAGSAANVYAYDPPAESFGDTGLVTPDNSSGSPAGLSHIVFCYDVETAFEELTVTKTADTSYIRTHGWSIAKSVDPAEFFLYTDGSGDGTATYTVDVTYEGYVDSDFAVSGDITIENTGTLDAVITSVDDVLAGATIAVDCGVAFPYTLPAGDTLTCSYDEAVASKIEGSNVATVTTERDAYSDEVPVTWGDPTTEINETVDVQDLNDLDNIVVLLGTVTAPNGDQFTYDKSFAWDDYGQALCGDHSYDNIAKVITTTRPLPTATATVNVHVQCLVFQGQSAWAANGDTPGIFRYTTRGNWATYVQYAEKTTTLFAGQTINVGTVTFSAVSGGNVTITVNLTGPWEFSNIAENFAVQGYASAPSGNPEPGQFANKKFCDPASSSCSIVVPAANYYGVHVNVGQWAPDPNFP